MVLENNKLMAISGGKVTGKVGLGLFIAALGSFIVGIVDGFLRPLKCN